MEWNVTLSVDVDAAVKVGHLSDGTTSFHLFPQRRCWHVQVPCTYMCLNGTRHSHIPCSTFEEIQK